MKLPRRRVAPLAVAAAALPAVSRVAVRRPIRRAGAHHRRLWRRWRDRCHRAPHRTMPSETTGRFPSSKTGPARGQYRDRGGRARAPDGSTLLVVGTWNANNAAPIRTSVSTSCAISRPSRASATSVCHGGRSFIPGQEIPEFMAYAKANPGKLEHGVARHQTRPSRGRTIEVHGRGRHGARALSTVRRGCPDRPARRQGADDVHAYLPSTIEYVRTGKLGALAVTNESDQAIAGDRRSVSSCRDTRERPRMASVRRRTHRSRSSASSTGRSARASPIRR